MDELLRKLINDTLSPNELQTLREKFNISSEEELLGLLDTHKDKSDEEIKVSSDIIRRAKTGIDRKLFGENSNPGKSRFKHIVSIAAVSLTLLVLGGMLIYILNRPIPAPGNCTLTTASGESTSLILCDGTSVKINSNSSLCFPAVFQKENREASFSGEAYFDIAKDSDSPFTITTPNMSVVVKGTSFNLISRSGSKYSELSLDSGSVDITPANSQKTVNVDPGTKLILNNSTGEISIIPIQSSASSSSWTSNELYFENATPEYLIDKIEQTYEITLDPQLCKLIDENFTGTLPSDDLDNTLRILTKVYSR